jgi:hypothetical protein
VVFGRRLRVYLRNRARQTAGETDVMVQMCGPGMIVAGILAVRAGKRAR